jgi:hypothetical protein
LASLIDIVSNIDPYGELDAMMRDALPKPQSALAADVCHTAGDLLAERGLKYDRPDGGTSMDRAVEAYNAITGDHMTEAKGWLLMQLLKDCRQWSHDGYHADSAEDAIAFAALKAVAKRRDEEAR